MSLADVAEIRPPENIEAEQQLLGALLIRNDQYERVADIVRPEDFADAIHGRIFGTMAKLIERGQSATPVTLKPLFEADEMMREIGGAEYIGRLAGSVLTVINAEDYARTILDMARRRRLIELAQDLIAEAATPDIERTSETIIEAAERRLCEIAETAGERGPVTIETPLDEALAEAEEAYKNQGKIIGVPTGLADLERRLGGLRAGELIILAGRPGMGKTTCAKTVALEAARAGHTVVIFSLEMPRKAIGQWLLADMTGISADRQRRGDLMPNDFDRLLSARQGLAELPLIIDDTPGLTIPAIRARARRIKRRRGLGLLVVDHLGLVSASRRAQDNGETAATTETSNALKRLSKELDVPVVALCQLNRAVESRDTKRPGLSDLRQSGAIEQDADIVLMVYRPEYYLQREQPERRPAEADDKFATRMADWEARLKEAKGICELIVAKNRSGPQGIVKVHFNPDRSRVENLSSMVLV